MKKKLRLFASTVLVGAVVAGVVFRSYVEAQLDATIVLARVLEVGVVDRPLRLLTREPSSLEIRLAGTEATLVTPAGDGPWPAIVFLTGASPQGRSHPRIRALGDGLARSGYVTIVPEVPGFREATIDPAVVDSVTEIVKAAAARPEVEGRRVALASVSVGASLALLVASSPESGTAPVSAVAGIAPYADLRTVIRIATTGTYRGPSGNLREYRADSFLFETLERSLAAGITPREHSQSLERLLANRDPERFDELYEALPARLRDKIRSLSPLTWARCLTMPVELATARRDKYFPVSESRLIADAAPRAQVTVTDALQHAIPNASASAITELARLDGFIVRFLRHVERQADRRPVAASGPPC